MTGELSTARFRGQLPLLIAVCRVEAVNRLALRAKDDNLLVHGGSGTDRLVSLRIAVGPGDVGFWSVAVGMLMA